jgi:uncharacterized protein YbjT (DUF2867 family)
MSFVAWLLFSRVRQLRRARLGRFPPKRTGGYTAPDKADVASAADSGKENSKETGKEFGKEATGATKADSLASTPGKPVGMRHHSYPANSVCGKLGGVLISGIQLLKDNPRINDCEPPPPRN